MTIFSLQGYYSILIYIFIDLSVNFIRMTVGSALDYICFTCIRCNGTTLIAEIHRLMINDVDLYVSKIREHDSLYEFLYSMAVEIQGPDSVGSCTEKRFTYSQGSNNTKWNRHQNDLLDVITDSFYIDESNQRGTKKKFEEGINSVMIELMSKDPATKKKKYSGIGYMGCIQFIHMSSLLGILPMYCFGYNRIRSLKLGPAKFIIQSLSQKGTEMSVEECNDHFEKVTEEFRSIWGIKITSSLIENTLCELWRSYKNTRSSIQKDNKGLNCDVDIITDVERFIDSRVNDVYYFDDRRQCIQNFFNVQTSGNGISELHPALVMKHSQLCATNPKKCTFNLTNWRRDGGDKGLMSWSDTEDERTIDTHLHVGDQLKNLLSFPPRKFSMK